ncbi:neurofilament heavy polypeptide-like [Chaetodon trifascialis]|uniref:neurofilament heavy polypeptide-like n=1 Tax=Chaetodon trifascialis TaxID=109706 RepID=UPI0039928F7B
MLMLIVASQTALAQPDSNGLSNQSKSVPALDPGRGLFRAKSPMSVSTGGSVARVRSPSPPNVRTPVKVPERFTSPEPPAKMAEHLRSPEPRQAALSPEPKVINSEREQNGLLGKSVVNGAAEDIKLPGNSTNQIDTTNDQNLPRKKVVKVVRRVVRKVLPTEEDRAPVSTKLSDQAPETAKPDAEPVKAVSAPASVSKPPVMSGFSFKHDVIKTEDKDDISRGLTNFIIRGRTRESRPRICRDEQPEKIESEKKNEKKEEKVELKEKKEQRKEDKTTLEPPDINHKSTGSDIVIQDVKPPVAFEHTAPASSKSSHSRPSSLPPVVGFIPAPKPSLLSPPPGFIPAPKPTAARKPTHANPPSTTQVAQKSFSLSPSSRFNPGSKPSPLTTPVNPDPPLPIPGQLSPPPGINPIQQPAVSQQEVQCPHLACMVNIWGIGGTAQSHRGGSETPDEDLQCPCKSLCFPSSYY